MTYTKTLLAVSVLSAFSVQAFAELTLPPIPEDSLFETILTDKNTSYGSATFDGKGLVRPTSEGGNAGYDAPVFLLTNGNANVVTNNGDIYVVAGQNASLGKYAAGMGASNGWKAVNNQTIVVKADNGWNYEATKAMSADGHSENATTIENNGTIWVSGATGMLATSLSATEVKKANIINHGTINVVGTGYAISLGGKDASGVTAENAGNIAVSGEAAFGLTTSDATAGTLTNSGSIVATEKATAVEIGRQEGTFTLQLKEGSQIDGNVLIQDKGTTTLDVEKVSDDFNLIASKISSLKLVDSQLGFNGDQEGGTTIGTMTTDAGSELAVFGDRQLTVETLEGDQANFKFDSLAAERLTIVTNNADNTAVAFTAVAVGTMTPEEAAAAMKDAVALGKNAAGEAVDGSLTANGNSFTVATNAAGEILNVTASDITQSSLDMAAMTLVAWRNETTTLTDRMSTLRSNPDQYGAWARWNGGEYKFDDRNLSNKFNTIEVGADTRIGNGPWTVGASLAYTKGEGDFVNGESDTDAYTGALYALWSHESGSFVDMMMKTGRINSDYDFFNEVGGGRDAASFKQTGFIMGVETGHRFALSDMVFVEPQLQLTYSRLAGIHETTEARTIDMEASDSLVGRIGVMAGVKCPNNVGDAYVRVSALRDFRGDVDGTFSGYKASQELDQNWVEFAVGANFKLADNFYTFVDVQKSTGGDIELDWRANVGAKMFF